MAEVVVPAQVFKQLVVVKIPVIAKFAEGVSSVAGVIWVSVCSVLCQFLAVIPLSLVTEDLVEEGRVSDIRQEEQLEQSKEQNETYLQVICTELTRENLMLFPHVLFKLLKPEKDFRLWTIAAYR